MPRRDNLARYNEKRDFTKTSEPKGIPKKRAGHCYLIQKHAARRLHYDFRLELDGTLKSWAVTRGPSLDPHDRRLAVEVEDHPIAYGSFEGTIPKGQYGGGTVMLWDTGTWEPIGDPQEGLDKGKLEFILHGKRLQGEWTLVRMKNRGEKRNNWLLIKRSDEFARPDDQDKFLEKNITSIVSSRRMEEIAANSNRVWQSNRGEEKDKPAFKHKIKKGKPKILPPFRGPQLATLVDTMPPGPQWVHEIKFDGYRVLAYIQDGKARLLTRTGLDWTKRFHPLDKFLAKLPSQTAIVDGEVVALDKEGASSFKSLQKILSGDEKGQLQYYAFDLPYLDGEDLASLPLLERKKKLQALLAGSNGPLFYSEHFSGGGEKFLKKLCGMRIEGAVSKRADAPYVNGRSKTWLKTKCHQRAEFVIGGFTLPTHKERGIGALLLGYYKDGDFVYAGKVGTGFDTQTSSDLRKKLNALAQKEMPFAKIQADGKRGAQWVKPQLVCEVEFTEWTSDGRLRHPSYQGLREDKPARDVHRDKPVPIKNVKEKGMAKAAGKSADGEVAGIRISHPDRMIYPGSKITKLRLAEYYHEIADYILPYVANRPLSMVRCPGGTGEPCFFQRHVAQGQSPHLYDAKVGVKDRTETYVMIKDVKGLITLIQWGVIELHPWGCRADQPQLPDQIIFDLDPDPALHFKLVMNGIKDIRARMEEFGLESFVKTTGGKGLHIVIPIARKYTWPAIKAFAKAIALSMEHDNPELYIAKSSKAGRKGKIFVDYLRNDLTSTAVAPYSARAREGAPVAVPLAWGELTPSLKPAQLTIETVPQRLAKLKRDPWKNFYSLKQKLSARHLSALNIEAE
jgi:bifunctional non-homologous end joining protein LigD